MPVNVGFASGAKPLAHVNPVPLVHWRAFDAELHEGIEKAVTPAVAAVAFANTVFAAILDKLLIEIPPGNDGEFVNVAFVNVAFPVTVRLLNVGLGYVWANAASGITNIAMSIFFMCDVAPERLELRPCRDESNTQTDIRDFVCLPRRNHG